MSDLSPEQKGRRAKEILEDPVFTEVLERTRESIVAQWTLTELNEVGVIYSCKAVALMRSCEDSALW